MIILLSLILIVIVVPLIDAMTQYYATTKTDDSLVITITITTTETVTQSPITYTITSMVTKTEVVTITVPESTLTITLRSLFSEDLVALAVAVTMIIASIAIGLKLGKK
jgi:hypothetical protein